MKIIRILMKLLMLTMLFAAIAMLSGAPAAEVFADKGDDGQPKKTVYNAVPRIPWSLSKDRSAMHAFRFGEGIHAFRFDPINIEKMEYLEFDIYLSDAKVVQQWKTGETELEITSSGISDINEYAWSGYGLWSQAAANGLLLRDGWNHVRLKLPRSSAADFSKINYIRWYWNEADTNGKTTDCRVANLKFTVKGGKDPDNVHLKPFIPATIFETEDVPVALANVIRAPYNADLTGEEDSTQAIQDALNDVSLNGGGTVWMPAGKYRITKPIRIPAFVTLRGDWADPETSAGYGTILVMDIPEEDRNDKGTIMLGGSGGVYGLTVIYPDQSPDDVKAYPFTFYAEDHIGDGYLMPSVINCTILNGYRGIGATTNVPSDPGSDDNGHENMYVLNFRGTFLACGAEAHYETDFGFWDNIKISNKYWVDASNAGVLPPVDEGRLEQYTKKHADGLILGDLEWASLHNVTIEDCAVGIHTVRGKRDYTDFQGQLYGITTRNCSRGLVADSLCTVNGMLLANSSIDGGIYNKTNTVIKMFNVTVNGPKEGKIREDADFTLDLPVHDSNFGYIKPKPILYTADLDLGGAKDVSAELQALLDRAGTTGGVVYLPGGLYRLDSPISVPAGVEIKGTSAVPTRDFPYGYIYNGATLLAYYTGSGPDDRALITLNGQGAGLNGIRINYPENRIRKSMFEKNLFNTAYAVKGAAPDVYIVNSFISSSTYGVDFTDCDRHLVKNLFSCCYRNALKLGGEGGVVSNCVQNPAMPFVSSTPYVILTEGIAYSYYGTLARSSTDYLILENASNELIYNIAMVCPHNMLTNNFSRGTTVINLSSDFMEGVQMTMNGGSMTVVNAMRWGGKSFVHEKGILKIYNRFEHCFQSELDGDAIEETYTAWK